jgi:galactokinase
MSRPHGTDGSPAPLGDRVRSAFRERFGAEPPILVRAPGRVNLIGEHTDYNDGFVLPMAIDRSVCIALRPGEGPVVRLHSLDFDEDVSIDVARFTARASGWAEYVQGTAWAMAGAGYELRGWDGVIAGNVPIGAGLSSSAALELATLRAFAAVGDLLWKPAVMARLGQKAENEWVGVNCGIMDQMISAAGQEGHALLIDCRSLDATAVPLPDGVVVVILDTATRRGLVDSAYNERRGRCEEAARTFGVPALRDIDRGTLDRRAAELDGETLKRARHVVSENERTLDAARAMLLGDAARLGRLMDESHESLRDDFAVSSEALDRMVAIARRQPGCLGARMTGAGFGGCAVALVAADEATSFADAAASAYHAETGLVPALYVSRARAGASVEHLGPDRPVRPSTETTTPLAGPQSPGRTAPAGADAVVT